MRCCNNEVGYVSSNAFLESMDVVIQYKRQLSSLRAQQVDFLPFDQDPSMKHPELMYPGSMRFIDVVEPYIPDRVARHFGYSQLIPIPPIVLAYIFYRSAIIKSYKANYSSSASFWNAF